MILGSADQIKRLVIYFFYDKEGIVDRYVPYMLEDIRKNCSELFIVCNGKLSAEGESVFLGLTPHLRVRENVGFDVWAYKEVLELYGWDRIAEFDEVVFMNSTIMGPVYPFSEMYEEMNKRDLDFWGINAFHKVPFDPFGKIPYGYVPWHLQSSFIAVRKSMLTSPDYHSYWENRPPVNSYEDAVSTHEAIFTKTFQDKGFICASYVDTSDMEEFTEYPALKAPVETIRDRRSPVFKRRSFFQPYYAMINESNGAQGRQLLEYIEKHTDYDVELIWENILRSCNLADIKNCLYLDYFLPDDHCIAPKKEARVALVMHIYFKDQVEYCHAYAKSMPEKSRIILTTDTEEKAEEIRRVFSRDMDVTVIQVENRGRDVSALLVGAREYIKDCDLVCFMHDKKVQQISCQMIGYYFSERCFKNCLATPEYVQNVIHTMMSNKHLGLLCPPPPNFADYYSTTGMEWGPNFENTKKLAESLGIHVNMDPKKEPIAPFGTMFWFKPDALKPLLDHPWKYEDFPKEPNDVDGTLLHAVERLYPFCAQSQGYYSAWGMTVDQAQLEFNNVNYMLRELNVLLLDKVGPGTFFQTRARVEALPRDASIRRRIKRLLKNRVPKPIWEKIRKVYNRLGGRKWVG